MKPPLLFIKHKDFNARTIDYDLFILKDNYDIILKNYNFTKGVNFFTSLFSQFFYLLFNIHRFKVIFIWFADYHSFLPVLFSGLFNKVCIVNVGGYDAGIVLIEEARTLSEKYRKFCVKYSLKKATKLLAVSTMMKDYVSKYLPGVDADVVYCCIDTELFKNKNQEKEYLIITVGGGGTFVDEAKRKRLDLFIEIGNLFIEKYPEYNAKFYLIGHDKDSETYKFLSPLIKYSNIELKPTINIPEELNEYYSKASVYMQLSYWESFGIAQIEAMYNRCIPVSNPGGAIPEVIGDAGFTIENYDIEKYIYTIKEILDKKHETMRERSRNRVIENFTLEIRREKVNHILQPLLKV